MVGGGAEGGGAEDVAGNAAAVNVGEEVEEVDAGEEVEDVTPAGEVSAAKGDAAEAVADPAGDEGARSAAAAARNAGAVEGGVEGVGGEAARSVGVDDAVAAAEAEADVVPAEEDGLAGAVPSVGAKSSLSHGVLRIWFNVLKFINEN